MLISLYLSRLLLPLTLDEAYKDRLKRVAESWKKSDDNPVRLSDRITCLRPSLYEKANLEVGLHVRQKSHVEDGH